MYAGFGITTVEQWNRQWSLAPHLWQWSDRLTAEAYARIQPCMTYVVEIKAEGYRPIFGTVKSTLIFESLTEKVTA